MENKPKKAAGRPAVSLARKAIKPNITVRADLLNEAEETARRLGMGLSEWVSRAVSRQIARDELVITESDQKAGFDKPPEVATMIRPLPAARAAKAKI